MRYSDDKQFDKINTPDQLDQVNSVDPVEQISSQMPSEQVAEIAKREKEKKKAELQIIIEKKKRKQQEAKDAAAAEKELKVHAKNEKKADAGNEKKADAGNDIDIKKQYLELIKNRMGEEYGGPSKANLIHDIAAGLHNVAAYSRGSKAEIAPNRMAKQKERFDKDHDKEKMLKNYLSLTSPGGKSNWRLATMEDEEGDPTLYRVNTLTGEKEKVGTRGYSPGSYYRKSPKSGDLVDIRKIGEDSGEALKVVTKYDDLNPNKKKIIDKAQESYIKDTKDMDDFQFALDNTKAFVDTNTDGTVGAIKRQLARSVGGEKGVLTDADANAFGGTDKVTTAIAQWMKAKAHGGMTEQIQENFNKIIKVAKKNMIRRKYSDRLKHLSPVLKRVTNMPEKNIRELMGMQQLPIAMSPPNPNDIKSTMYVSELKSLMAQENIPRNKIKEYVKKNGIMVIKD